jgi:hypothetical protein
MDLSNRRSLNTRYTLVDGQLQDQLLHFVYDHQENQLLVQPRGRLLFEVNQIDDMWAIDPLGMIVTPARNLRRSMMKKSQPAINGGPEETGQVVDEWFDYLIQQAQDARSQFLN